MICEVCSAMFDYNGQTLRLYEKLIHHRSVDSLAKSALDDCQICQPLWEENCSSFQEDLRLQDSRILQPRTRSTNARDYCVTSGELVYVYSDRGYADDNLDYHSPTRTLYLYIYRHGANGANHLTTYQLTLVSEGEPCPQFQSNFVLCSRVQIKKLQLGQEAHCNYPIHLPNKLGIMSRPGCKNA